MSGTVTTLSGIYTLRLVQPLDRLPGLLPLDLPVVEVETHLESYKTHGSRRVTPTHNHIARKFVFSSKLGLSGR